MTYLKCTSCKARLYSASGSDSLALCPGCGAMLDPIGELVEVVGYRSIRPHRAAARHAAHAPVIDRFAELLADSRARAESRSGGRTSPRA